VVVEPFFCFGTGRDAIGTRRWFQLGIWRRSDIDQTWAIEIKLHIRSGQRTMSKPAFLRGKKTALTEGDPLWPIQ